MTPASDCSAAEKAADDADQLRAEWKFDALKEAVRKYAEAETCWRLTGELSKQADALKNIGDVYFILSDYPKARDAYERAVKLNRSTGDQNRLADALNGLGLTCIYVGDIDQSLKHSNEALSISLQTTDKRAQAYALNNIGFNQYMQGDLAAALNTFNRARTHAEEINYPLLIAHILLNIGYTHNDAGELEDALSFYQQALPMWEKSHNFRGLSRTLTAIGGVHTVLGKIQEALDHHRRALEIVRNMGDSDGQAIIGNSIGYTYEVLGDYERARNSYLEALNNFNVVGNIAGQAQTSQFVGNIYRLLGDNDKAEDYYLKCLSLSRMVKARTLEAFALNSLGSVAKAKLDTQKSLQNFRQALNLYREIGNRRGEAVALNNLGQLTSATGMKQAALSYHMRALPLAEATGDSILEITTRGHIAELERDADRLSEARSHIEAALKTIETIRTRVSSYELRSSYLATTRRHYELYIDVLMLLHKRQPTEGFDALALRASELARARNLLDLLIQSKADIREGITPELLEKEASLRTRLDRLAERQLRLNAQNASEQTKSLESEIRSLANEYEQVRTNIREQSPRYAALMQPTPIGLEEIQQVLDDETLLLEYALGDERSYVWVVSRNKLWSFELRGRAEIENAARSVYELLTADRPMPNEDFEQRRSRVATANEQLPSSINILSRLLLEPVTSKLSSQRLLVVADGALQYIPFQILAKPLSLTENSVNSGKDIQNTPWRQLILDHVIVNQPSASALALLIAETKKRKPAPNSVAVLADPVFNSDDSRITAARTVHASISEPAKSPETELQRTVRDVGVDGGAIPRLWASGDEADAIMSAAPWWSGFKATGFDASKQTAMSAELGHYAAVHFATHGFLNDEHPELSGIVFSLFDQNGQPQDGFLRLNDIYNLKLPVDLVVLSACSTGLGKDVKGEGLIGLTRGFMYAGAASVVASLWRVDDEATAELMGYFYEYMLQDGLPAAAALRQAQLKMSQQKRWQSPYYWSGFVIQGQYNQTAKANYVNRGGIVALLVGLVAVVGVASIFVLRQKRKAVH